MNASILIDNIAKIDAHVFGIEYNFAYTTNSTGMPPLSMRVSVIGGEVDEIARVIEDYRFAGFVTCGDTTGTATDYRDMEIDIWFNHVQYRNMPPAIEMSETKELADYYKVLNDKGLTEIGKLTSERRRL